MTDLKTIKYWKERLAKEDETDSDCGKLRILNGRLLHQIDKLINQINLNNDEIVRKKWHWWYQIKLAERVMRLFKLKKDIYSSKDATDYWRKRYMGKGCKIKAGKIDELYRDVVLGYLAEKSKDSPYFPSYAVVICDLKENKDE